MEKFILNYRVIVEPDTRVGTNEKCFTAYCPTLGIADDGDTIDEALESIREGIQCYVEALVKDGEEVPSPELKWLFTQDLLLKELLRQSLIKRN